MAFTASAIFRESITEMLLNTVAYTLNTDAHKVALYNNTGTPDKDAAGALNAYNGGAWVTTNEVTDATNWTATGRPLVTPTVTNPATGVIMFDGVDTAGAGNVTLSGVMGCLVYDTTVTNQGLCYNWFGGAQSVTAGTFTIVWSANGIFRITV